MGCNASKESDAISSSSASAAVTGGVPVKPTEKATASVGGVKGKDSSVAKPETSPAPSSSNQEIPALVKKVPASTTTTNKAPSEDTSLPARATTAAGAASQESQTDTTQSTSATTMSNGGGDENPPSGGVPNKGGGGTAVPPPPTTTSSSTTAAAVAAAAGRSPQHSPPPPSSRGGGTDDDTASEHSGTSGKSGSTSGNGKASLKHTTSKIFSELEDRREDGDLKAKVVHIEVPFGKPIEEVYAGVHTGPVLGSGISGLVRLVTHKATGVKYAVKCLDLGLIESEEGLQQLREEIFIMCQLDHPNIVRLEEVYESHNEIYLVQELCLGGELFDRLDEQPDYHYTEAQCARLVKQMLCAVRYIHSKGIVHRDLKLENFLFSTTSPDSELKMIDFGLSKHFVHGEHHDEAVGTPYTVAPEVIVGRYDERCDIWAIGVIAFLLLSGDPPFGGCGGPEPLSMVRENILKGKFHFEPEDIWENVSQQAKDFIKLLLVTDPTLRPTAAQAQKSPWLREWLNNEKKRKKDGGKLNPNVVNALVNFKEYSDMRKLLSEVLSFTLLPDQIQDLRAEFEKMDTEGSGEISLDGLKNVLLMNAGAGSLGALTEGEVEDIFNAMRVRKSNLTIQWHEFIAAGLSQCEVDERNLRLAFDRLDSAHKGFISFDDVLDLMGNSATEESLRLCFQESLHSLASPHARITYDDFLLLMKGQTRSTPGGAMVEHSPIVSTRRPRIDRLAEVEEEGFSLDGSPTRPGPPMGAIPLMPSLGDSGAGSQRAKASEAFQTLDAVPEGCSVKEHRTDTTDDDEPSTPSRPEPELTGDLAISDEHAVDKVPPSPPSIPKSNSLSSYEKNLGVDVGPLSFDGEDENIVGLTGKRADNMGAFRSQSLSSIRDGSTDMNNTSDFNPELGQSKECQDQQIAQNATTQIGLAMKRLSQRNGSGGPRQMGTTANGAEPLTPPRLKSAVSESAVRISPTLMSPGKITPLGRTLRHRSKSVDDQDSSSSASPREGTYYSDSRRSVALPEHTHTSDIIEDLINDESRTPLVVNRELYRAHRKMRLAVLEASKRFEEKKVTREVRQARQQAGDDNQGQNEMGVPAGLVMRRGATRQLSSESVRHLLQQRQQEEQVKLEQVYKKSGRGRSRRTRTVSDMTGMLSATPSATP